MRVAYTVQKGAEIAAKPFIFGARWGYRGVSVLVEQSQPRNKWVWGACVVTGIWAHRMAEVYAPGIMADLIVSHTVSKWGTLIGTIYGMFFVAPGMVPTLVPFVAYGSGAIVALITVLAINSLCLLILGKPLKQNDAAKTS